MNKCTHKHTNRTDSLTEEIASLKQKLNSCESTPDSASGDLQQQLDSARADATKQASKLAQAEMRASLVRQQLQEAHYQLRQLEQKAQHGPQADELQESLDKANSELNMLQGRLSPVGGQVRDTSFCDTKLYCQRHLTLVTLRCAAFSNSQTHLAVVTLRGL